jgi:hypothetical protein
MAVLVVLFVVVAVNSFLYFGYHAPAVPPAPSTEATPLATDEGTNPSTIPEPTDGQKEGGQRLRETSGETVPSSGAATTDSPSTTSSASASPSLP